MRLNETQIGPGSHRRGLAAHEIEDGRRLSPHPVNGMPLPTLNPGDVCIFDRNTLQSSGINNTPDHRYAYAAQYMDSKARMGATGAVDEDKPLVAHLKLQLRIAM